MELLLFMTSPAHRPFKMSKNGSSKSPTMTVTQYQKSWLVIKPIYAAKVGLKNLWKFSKIFEKFFWKIMAWGLLQNLKKNLEYFSNPKKSIGKRLSVLPSRKKSNILNLRQNLPRASMIFSITWLSLGWKKRAGPIGNQRVRMQWNWRRKRKRKNHFVSYEKMAKNFTHVYSVTHLTEKIIQIFIPEETYKIISNRLMIDVIMTSYARGILHLRLFSMTSQIAK